MNKILICAVFFMTVTVNNVFSNNIKNNKVEFKLLGGKQWMSSIKVTNGYEEAIQLDISTGNKLEYVKFEFFINGHWKELKIEKGRIPTGRKLLIPAKITSYVTANMKSVKGRVSFPVSIRVRVYVPYSKKWVKSSKLILTANGDSSVP